MPQAAAFDPSQPFTPVAAFDPSKPFMKADEPTPDFRATNEPPSAWSKATAYGKDAASLALDALPGAGAVIGGVLATPETLGGGTLAGAALGAGAGKGARDFLKAAFGFERPTTALDEAGRIARDTAETYVVGKILPALWAGIKNPKATVGDVYGEMATLYKGLPKAVKAFLPDIEAYRASLPAPVAKAPAAILQRPAWQSWEVPEHLDRSKPIPPSALTQEQLAERVFGGQGAPTPPVEKPPLGRVRGVSDVIAPDVAPVPPAAAAPDVPARPAAPGAPSAVPPSPPGSQSLPDQKALNEAALAQRRAAYQARVQGDALAAKGQPQPPPPVLDPEAQAIRDQTATATQTPAPARIKLTAPETKEYLRLRQGGMSDPQAIEALQAARDFQAKFGTPTPTVAQTKFPKGPRGSRGGSLGTIAAPSESIGAAPGEPVTSAQGPAPGAQPTPLDQMKTATIRAYHGSPHDFEQFDMSKIGSGEGAQAYGHGLYFAENEGVARGYRAALSPDAFPDGDPRNGIAKILVAKGEADGLPLIRKAFANLGDGLDAAIQDARQGLAQTGKTYEVAIKADPAHMLDWDKPLSEQSPQVQQAMEELPIPMRARWKESGAWEHVKGRELYQQIQRAIQTDQVPSQLGRGGGELRPSAIGASDVLNKASIPGIKYLDQGSRAAGEGSRNYVVFHDAVIDILRKYGILLPAAGVGAATVAQRQRQGVH